MILEQDILIDDIDDEVGDLLRNIQSIQTWTQQRRELLQTAVTLLKKQPHKEFTANKLHFGLKSVGHSIKYQVPQNKTGYLKEFRGNLVRLVCIKSAGSFRYKILALPISEDWDAKI